MKNNKTASSVGFVDLLAVTFIVLKLTGVISWSWWWVLAPLWGQLVLAAIVVFIWCKIK